MNDRDYDIMLLEIQSANEKLIEEWKQEQLGKRGARNNALEEPQAEAMPEAPLEEGVY